MEVGRSKKKKFCETFWPKRTKKRTQLFCETSCKMRTELRSWDHLWDFLQNSKFPTSKTKQLCETSIKNEKLNADLTASYQWVLRCFHPISLKYCACHEKWGQARVGLLSLWRGAAFSRFSWIRVKGSYEFSGMSFYDALARISWCISEGSFWSQNSDHMDRWKSKESEKRKEEDQRRERVRRINVLWLQRAEK